MEFEEIRKIWEKQNVKPLYEMNDTVLYRQVVDKHRRDTHLTQISELMVVLFNLGASVFIFCVTLTTSMSLSMIVLAAWLGVSGGWVLFERLRCARGNQKFDRSLQGELNFALSIATYQVRVARLWRWNAVPIGALTLLALWESDKAGWLYAVFIVVFVISYVVAAWGADSYSKRKHELEVLQKKIDALQS